jgi:hypothetical protein
MNSAWNTLIGAGTTASVGGLIIIGLGVVAGQLRRVAEALAMPLPGRPVQPPELSESAAAPRPAPGRTPYPAKPPSAALDPMHAPAANPYEDKFEEVSAPRLRNPDISEVEEEISLSPPRPAMAPVKPPANDLSAFGRPSAGPPPTVATARVKKTARRPGDPRHLRLRLLRRDLEQTSMQCGPPRQSQKSRRIVNRKQRQRLNRYHAIRS